jgi:nitroreductase
MGTTRWDIRLDGRPWDSSEGFVRFQLTPERFEMTEGKLFWSDEERETMLALLLENVGARRAVQLGDPKVWKQAVAEDFFTLAESRYSVRAYTSQPVDDETLQRVLRAAQLAPTAANRQPFRITVLETRGLETELRQLYHRDWFSQAPLVIGVCAVSSEAWIRGDGMNYAAVDATIAMDHLILAATALGLGTCWVAAFDPAVARTLLRLPDGMEPVAFTPLGYPADQPAPKTRRPLAELVLRPRVNRSQA